jgi:hypothetical protein
LQQVLALWAQRQDLHGETREDPMTALIRLRPLAAMIHVVRTQIVDGAPVPVAVPVAVVQLDDGEPIEACDGRTGLPCTCDLTPEERAAALRELAQDLRSRAADDPRYASRHVPEAA